MKRGRDRGSDGSDRERHGHHEGPRPPGKGPRGAHGRPRRWKAPAGKPERHAAGGDVAAGQSHHHGQRRPDDRRSLRPITDAHQQPRAAAAPLAPASRDLVFGAEPVHELAAAAAGIVRVLYVRDDLTSRFAEDIRRVRAAGGRIESVDAAALARMAGAEARHQGMVAFIREYNYEPFESVIAAKPDPLLLVDGVTDPRNLGALLRSAEGAGVQAVVLARDRTAGLAPAAIKSSAGAWIHLKITRCGNVARALEDLKQAGYWVAALAPDGDVDLYALDTSRRLVMVVGSEEHGIRGIVRKNADFVVRIPMRGRVGSLNVSVAAAVALFEVAHQRAHADEQGTIAHSASGPAERR